MRLIFLPCLSSPHYTSIKTNFVHINVNITIFSQFILFAERLKIAFPHFISLIHLPDIPIPLPFLSQPKLYGLLRSS